MLIEFKVANFRSFKEEQTLSFVASKDETHPGNLIECEKFNLLKAMGVYGANAAGKSNLVSAMRTMRLFVIRSATKMNQGDVIPGMTPFRLARDYHARPCFFEITLIVDNTRFQYGFRASADHVHGEWLNVYPPTGRRHRWLERELDTSSGDTRWSFRGPLEPEGSILKERTRENCLVLSRGAELNVESLSDLFLRFRRDLRVFDLSSAPSLGDAAFQMAGDEAFRKRVVDLAGNADLGIADIEVRQRSLSEADFAHFPGELKEIVDAMIRKFRGKSALQLLSKHRIAGVKKEELFDFEEAESDGTQRFVALLAPWLTALDRGQVVVIDELERSMHPLLTRKLIELFQSPEANKNGAQLVFATHDSTLMDSALFRRDQIWLVEKNSEGASELFSLYDFDTKDRPRSTTAFQRNYLAGRYGGVPDFGPAFEDLELE